jgi:hypothetical protein
MFVHKRLKNIIFGPQKIENKYFDPSKFAICVFCNRMKKSRALMKLKE